MTKSQLHQDNVRLRHQCARLIASVNKLTDQRNVDTERLKKALARNAEDTELLEVCVEMLLEGRGKAILRPSEQKPVTCELYLMRSRRKAKANRG